MKIKELLASPDSWTQGTVAQDAQGNPVGYSNEKAVCWCLLGALMKCYSDPDEQLRISLRISEALKKHHNVPLILPYTFWNDLESRTHEEVLALVNELDI